jgi:hypothetical protein
MERAELHPGTAVGAGVEARAAPRYDCAKRICCTRMATSEVLSVLVRNLSKTGIGLVVERPLPTRDQLALTLPELDPPHPTTVAVEVVHCMRYTPRSWLIGAKFSTPLDDQQMLLLLRKWT